MTAIITRTLVVVAVLLAPPHAMATGVDISNQLRDHPAPYLALHGEDPVAWQQWGPEVVQQARDSNRILLLSIGYFACHWCHVMQRESFQNEEIAAFVNRHFLPVKIDRELEPALDARLMDFTQATLGRGGWPLNVFVTPDGYPVYAALYLPPPHFMETLQRMQELWRDDEQRILELVRAEATTSFADAEPVLPLEQTMRLIEAADEAILQTGDEFDGGFGQQNKFPSTPQLTFLLRRYADTEAEETGAFLETTLDAMAQRGLHDHLSGGFFRYAVDPGWGIPHFEKMLYDNANLAMLYLEAGRVLDNPHYFEVARRTLDFMRDRMWHDDGALVASFSAVDDANVEGGYYLWQAQDLAGVLTQEEVQLAASLWGLGRPAELEAGNHIRYAMTLQEYAEESGIDAADAASVLQRTREKLLAARDRRSLPVDDKLIAGWNGLALHAFAAAAKTWPDSSYPETAAALREFLLEQLWQDGRLQRALAAGRPLGSASLEDYAYVAAGLLSWARLNDRRQDYVEARSVAEAAWSRFYRDNGWYQEDGTLLAPTSAEEMVADGAMASPAAVVIEVSLELAAYFDDEGMRRRALSALNRGDTLLSRAPYWYASQLGARALAISP